MKSLKKTMFYSMIVTVLILSYWIYSCLNFSLSNENDFTLIVPSAEPSVSHNSDCKVLESKM